MFFWKKKEKNKQEEATEETVEETAEETSEAEKNENEEEATDDSQNIPDDKADQTEAEGDVAENTDTEEEIPEEENVEEKKSESEDTETVEGPKKEGFFKRLVSGLTKTRNNIVAGIDNIFSGFSKIDDDFYEELEETLIMGDIGVNTTMEIIERLKEKVKENHIKEPQACKELLIESITQQMDLGENAYDFENQKSVILVIGVNGVGKTTSIGKLSGQFKKEGKKVVLAAADTFRAAAADQLKEWANRAGVDIISGEEGADPGAVLFDAIAASKSRDADILLCDTAGRLHNKKNLMAELKKIDRIIEKEYNGVYRENLIVLDATTGQNALAQAKTFMECTDITGVILTKMDGTAKGGIAVAIQSELGIPVKYIGVGEQIDDLQKFDSRQFVEALFDKNDNMEKEEDM